MGRRVVITSIGVVSSLGNTEPEIMDNLKSGKVGFSKSDYNEDILICPVQNFVSMRRNSSSFSFTSTCQP